jgi:hypothetical protein
MSDFQIIISGQNKANSEADPDDLDYEAQSGNAVDRIEDLQEIWPDVMDRLNKIAQQSCSSNSDSGFVIDEIEFNIGIEAGLSLGLVTKGTAAVSIKFARRR